LQKVTYLNLPNCLRLSNGTIEVVVTTDIGPRVLRYGFTDGQNVLGEVPEASVSTSWGDWKPIGGHRLWSSPEAMPRSYAPDNDVVEFAQLDDLTVRLTPGIEKHTGLQKEITIAVDAEGTGVTLRHRITNRNVRPVDLSVWALTIMRGGGEAIIPQEPYGPHPEYLLPARSLVLWPYTDMSDARFTFGRKYIRVKSEVSASAPQKIGVANKQGWAAYLLGETLFVKRFGYEEGASYPDGGCNNEVFMAGSFIEVESLSPLKLLAQDEAAEHEERWSLFNGVKTGAGEEGLDEALLHVA